MEINKASRPTYPASISLTKKERIYMINNHRGAENIGDEPIPEEINQKFSFSDLLAAAHKEEWEKVDDNISKFCDDPVIIRWALTIGISNGDGNLRDLAVSIIEKSSCKLDEQNILDLLQKLDQDENPYVRFRSAFALFTHGDKSEKVIKKIREAMQNNAVKEIAEGYLSQVDK